MLKEWPLVAFTVAGQTAAGVSLLFFLPLIVSSEPSRSLKTRGVVPALFAVVLGLLVIAAALSFFHLRHPFRARRVLVNLRTSWLSREILFELVLMAFVALALVLAWTENTEGLLFRAVTAAAVLSAILFLASMSKLYMLESLPPWDSAFTGISFFLTAATLGVMATAWVTGASAGDPHSHLSRLWTAALVFIAADVFFAVLLTPQHGLAGFRSEPSLRPLPRAPRLLHLGRLALLAGGFVLIVLTTVLKVPSSAGGLGPGTTLTLALILVLLGEVAGRFLFYGLVPRPGD